MSKVKRFLEEIMNISTPTDTEDDNDFDIDVDVIKDALINFFQTNENPTMDDVAKLADDLDIDASDLEEIILSVVSDIASSNEEKGA